MWFLVRLSSVSLISCHLYFYKFYINIICPLFRESVLLFTRDFKGRALIFELLVSLWLNCLTIKLLRLSSGKNLDVMVHFCIARIIQVFSCFYNSILLFSKYTCQQILIAMAFFLEITFKSNVITMFTLSEMSKNVKSSTE